MDESYLLRQFIEKDSQEAFASLVEQYIDLVYSTCLREVRDPALAEDLTQAVFLLLARKAPTIARGTPLSGWLFQSARFASKDALKQEARRRQRERKAAEEMMRELATEEDGAVWEEIELLLNESLARLGSGDRHAILLRFFENRSLRETGAALGISEKAAEKRVARAVERLRCSFRRHGLLVSAATLICLLPANAVHATPPHCIAGAVGAASNAAASGGATDVVSGGMIGSKGVAIYQSLARTILLGQMKTAVGGVAGLILVGAGVTGIAHYVTATSAHRQPTIMAGLRSPIIRTPMRMPRATNLINRSLAPLGRIKARVAMGTSPARPPTPAAPSLASNDRIAMLNTPARVSAPPRVVLPGLTSVVRNHTQFQRINMYSTQFTSPVIQRSVENISRRTRVGVLSALMGAMALAEAPAPIQAQPPVQLPAPPLAARKIIITTTSDNGPGSLRQAVLDAGAAPGSSIVFNIPITDPNFKDGIFTIQPETPLPAIKGTGTILDGSTQTAFTGDTNKAGPEIVLKSGPGTKRRHALYINGANCIVKSLVINNVPGSNYFESVLITGAGATGNHVVGCYIGVDPTGTQPLGAVVGVQLESGASGNIIGGVTAESRNVVAGNDTQIKIMGKGTNGNMVQGNYIGTDALGEKRLRDDRAAISIAIEPGASANLIGGTVAGAGNVIGGDPQGIGISMAGGGTDGNIVQGNYVGTNKAGTAVITTFMFGVLLRDGVQKTQIGGTASSATNIIAGCSEAGIQLTSADNNILQRNYIGCDVTGTKALGNLSGLIVYASSGNMIGGAALGAGNVISGNTKGGILIMSEAGQVGATQNIVQGNYIGLGADGKTALGNGVGIRVSGAANNVIGLAEDNIGAGNTVAFNKGAGTLVDGENKPQGNSVRGNNIHGNGA